MPPAPFELYQKRLKEGLRPDLDQERAVQVLQDLYAQIICLHCHSGVSRNLLTLWRKIPFFNGMTTAIKGVYLYGPVGRGKSMVMDLFYDSLPPDMPKRRVHFHAFMIEVHDYIHARRMDESRAEHVDTVLPALAKEIAAKTRVLCFDEFHVVDVADAMLLGRLFTALFERGLIVVATSNWPPERLYEGGLQRELFLPFIDLLKEKMNVVAIESKQDYRAQMLREEGTYFWPLSETTREKVNKVFDQITDDAELYEDVIEVKGRKIKVPLAAAGAARFSFSQLCERPHGAEDYLAIARAYRTVFLEGVPKLGYDRRNEAKRLMTLIDALYESRTKLVVSADAPPEGLYSGQDHGFEFRRTVSRLLEMQSAKYLENA